MENTDKWDKARMKAEETFQIVYLPKVMDTKHPPKAYLRLEGRNGKYSLHGDNTLADMDLPEIDCPELTEKTADAVTDASMHQLFVSTQMNNLDLCAKSALQWVTCIRYCSQMLTITQRYLACQQLALGKCYHWCFYSVSTFLGMHDVSMKWALKNFIIENRLQEIPM